jgi:hypothetical protein
MIEDGKDPAQFVAGKEKRGRGGSLYLISQGTR